jgi:hypothetical protein
VAEAWARRLEQALGLLARDAPLHFAATRAHLDGRAALVRVGDGPARRVCLAQGPPFVTAGLEGALEVALSEADLDAFLRGQVTLEEAVEADRLRVRGSVDDVLRLFDALASWLHGALRCPRLAQLRDQQISVQTTKGAQQS